MYSQFSQFEINRIIEIMPLGLDISITNATIYLLLPVILLYGLSSTTVSLVPGRYQGLIELVYNLIKDLVKESIGDEGKKYLGFIWSLFWLILIMNLVGIIPYTFAPTAHIFITFGLSFSIFIGCAIIAIRIHGLNFFSGFMPLGCPMYLAPFLVIIEAISYCAKAISLGVRLTANITAGHLLFSILAGFGFTMLEAGGSLAFASIIPIAIVLAITVLEIAVAVIQAYVFCLLTTIFINDAIHLH